MATDGVFHFLISPDFLPLTKYTELLQLYATVCKSKMFVSFHGETDETEAHIHVFLYTAWRNKRLQMCLQSFISCCKENILDSEPVNNFLKTFSNEVPKAIWRSSAFSTLNVKNKHIEHNGESLNYKNDFYKYIKECLKMRTVTIRNQDCMSWITLSADKKKLKSKIIKAELSIPNTEENSDEETSEQTKAMKLKLEQWDEIEKIIIQTESKTILELKERMNSDLFRLLHARAGTQWIAIASAIFDSHTYESLNAENNMTYIEKNLKVALNNYRLADQGGVLWDRCHWLERFLLLNKINIPQFLLRLSKFFTTEYMTTPFDKQDETEELNRYIQMSSRQDNHKKNCIYIAG